VATVVVCDRGTHTSAVLASVKGLEIESVAWDVRNESVDTTGTFLVGTADGNIVEVVIENKREKRVVQVRRRCCRPCVQCPLVDCSWLCCDRVQGYRIAEAVAVTGLKYEVFPGVTPQRIFVMATTARPIRYGSASASCHGALACDVRLPLPPALPW
jgi:hypothetical protein